MSERVVYCHRCGSCDDRRLYVPLRDGHVCAGCWHVVGRPFPRSEAAPALVHEAELRTRERMAARGGTDRHLVRNGRT